MNVRRRVYAYITSGRRLLVFEHLDHPEAGIQVPAGTLEPGEDPREAVLREAWEETGLQRLELVAPLGTLVYDMRCFGVEERQLAHYYHLHCLGDAPPRWRHDETSGGAHAPIRFELYWADLDRPPPLVALDAALLGPLRWSVRARDPQRDAATLSDRPRRTR